MQIINMKLSDIHPYEKNPRFNDDAVEAVAASIKTEENGCVSCTAYAQTAQLSAFEKDFGKANFLLDEADRVLPAGQKIEIARMRSQVRILENKFEEAIEINRKIIDTPDVNAAFAAEAHSKNAWIYYYKLKVPGLGGPCLLQKKSAGGAGF